MENKPRKKVLVIRFSAIGDIVLSTPVFKALHDAGYEVHWLVKGKYSFVLQNFKYIHQQHHFPLSSEAKNTLKEENFDYIIDLQNNIKSFKIKRFLKRPTNAVKKLNFEKLVLVRLGIDLLKENRSIVKRYMDTLAPLGITEAMDDHILFPQKSIETPQVPYITWVLGATYAGKKIDLPTIKAGILLHPEKHFVFLGGATEHAMAEDLCSSLKNTSNYCGKTSLEQAAYLMEHSELTITNDTGLMHIAASTSTPIIALWGCTSPLLGMGAHKAPGGIYNVEPLHRKKRPCSKLGNHCKYKSNCATQIQASQISQIIKEICGQ